MMGSFRPLAGIWSVESQSQSFQMALQRVVSVPLRGFGQWKERHLKQLLGEDSIEGFRKPLF